MNSQTSGAAAEAHFQDDETADFSASEMARHAAFQPTAVSAIHWRPTTFRAAPTSLPSSLSSTNERLTTATAIRLLVRPYTDTPDALGLSSIAPNSRTKVFSWAAPSANKTASAVWQRFLGYSRICRLPR